jgi:transcription elongation factor Elf1
MATRTKALVGEFINGFELVEYLGGILKHGKKNRYGNFKCPYCEKIFKTSFIDVKRKNKISCGCKRIFSPNRIKHGMCGTKVYRAWSDIKGRCLNKNNEYYNDYGGRGITVCDEWMEFAPFYEWSINNGFDDKLEIDRIHVNGNYEPENCRWVTRCVNVQNTRLLCKNNNTGYRGVRLIKRKKGNIYQANIRNNCSTFYLGTFSTPKEAALAYNNYVIENKTFHPLNIIE